MMAYNTTETDNNMGCQYQYPWSDKDEKIIHEYKTWLIDEWLRVNTLESRGPTGEPWPKKPKVDARTLDGAVKMKRTKLSGQELHEYLMQNIITANEHPGLEMNPMVGASVSLESLQTRLREVWENIKKAQQQMVSWYIDYGNALNIAFFQCTNSQVIRVAELKHGKCGFKKTLVFHHHMEENFVLLQNYYSHTPGLES